VRDNRLAFWIILIAFFIALLSLPTPFSAAVKAGVREAFSPLQAGVTRFWRGVRESASSVQGYRRLLEENRRMSAEMSRLMGEVRDLKLLATENEALRTHLDFARRESRAYVPCEVIARNREGWWQSVRLDKGSGDGIAPGMAVLSVEGLVGRTVEVSEHTCDVLLLSDPACKVSAQIARTGSFGVVAGRGPSWKGQAICRMEFINKNDEIRPGDEIITSGLGGVYPRGLLVGYVDRVVTDASGLFQYADIVVKADLGTLEYAFVVKGGDARAAEPIETGTREADE
jgi:rod shape-determining protein MreC